MLRKKSFWILLVLVSFVGASTANAAMLQPVDDNWILINTANPGQYGSYNPGADHSELRVGDNTSQSRHYRSFLKFDLSGISDSMTITSATLALRLKGGSGAIALVARDVADDTWTEGGITWDNQPAYGGLACNHGDVSQSAPQWVTMDVTASVVAAFDPGDDLWSIVLKDDNELLTVTNQRFFYSAEVGSSEPYLDITVIPEPMTILVLASGAVVLGRRRRYIS